MLLQLKKTFFNASVKADLSTAKGRFFKAGSMALLIGAVLVGGTLSGERRYIEESHRRSTLQEIECCNRSHSNGIRREYCQINEQAPQKQERRNALNIIKGVVSMYSEDVQFNTPIKIRFKIGERAPELNASYTHATKTFEFPHVLRNLKSIVRTALDQGIVSHEAGHMILHHLHKLGNTAHMGALHEAFADLTSHFYRFYNDQTCWDFINGLENGQGCVGDTDFTCTRNSSQPLTLRHVQSNQRLCEVHDLSKPFSNAVYQSMVDAFAEREANSVDEYIAGKIVKWHRRTLVNAVLSLKSPTPMLMDVALRMLYVSSHIPTYRDYLGNNFIRNGLIVLIYRSPTQYNSCRVAFYSTNEEFSTLCLTEQEYLKTKSVFRGLCLN